MTLHASSAHTDSPHIIVAGSTGIAGSYIASHLRQTGLKVTGMSRSGRDGLMADMLVADQVNAHADALATATHLVYAAFAGNGADPWSSLTATNARMFETVLTATEHHASALQRVVLIQGQKYYGTHLGPFRTPARESDPRHIGENFYFDQQDLLAQRSADADWDYSCLRPHIICGLNMRAPQNPIAVLSRYAALMKLSGQPLHWPGHPDAYNKLCQATDATLLGEAVHWALSEPMAGGEGFNLINGDYFRWSHMWEVVAAAFDMPIGEVRPTNLIESMPALNERYLSSFENPDWAFANYMLTREYDVMASMVKARSAGFDGYRDSERSFDGLLRQARAHLMPTSVN